jgi:hypothetical protein
MNDVILRNYSALAVGEDPFQIAFRPAQPALDAIISVREPMAWLNRQRRSGKPLYDPDEAAELVEIIPESRQLAVAGRLFLEAEEQPAPEGWLHVALGLAPSNFTTRLANQPHGLIGTGTVDSGVVILSNSVVDAVGAGMQSFISRVLSGHHWIDAHFGPPV